MADDPEKQEGTRTLLSRIPMTDEKILQDIQNRKAEHNHYSAIGRVAAAWSWLEAMLDSASIRLAEVEPQVGVCFTSQISGFARKIDAFISLARYFGASEDLISRLCAFSREASRAAEKRNRYIHDAWYFDHPHDPVRLEATARKLVKIEPISTPTQNLIDLCIHINRLCDRLSSLEDEVVEAKASLRRSSSSDPA